MDWVTFDAAAVKVVDSTVNGLPAKVVGLVGGRGVVVLVVVVVTFTVNGAAVELWSGISVDWTASSIL